MNVEAAKEAARVYYDYLPGKRWDAEWNNLSPHAKTIWYDVAKAVEPLCETEGATEVNTGPVVDTDARVLITDLQAEVSKLTKRVESLESLTRPIGSAKVVGEELISGGKTLLDLTSKIVGKE